MSVASVARPAICPQCGVDWAGRLEFCPRCGSPVAQLRFDPLRAPVYGSIGLRVNRRAKFVIRSGILGIGVVGLLTGALLCYGGWVNPENLDLVQLWISRLGGPLLIVQGVVYSWLPFRPPVCAQIIPFPKSPRR